MLSLFILGATGYIGNALIFRIKQEIPELRVIALIRNTEHIKTLRDAGVTVELGDANDMGKVVDMTSKADIIVNAASSDSIPLIQAILTGQRIYSETGRRSTLVHLSRTAHSLHQEESRFLQLHTTRFDDMHLEWLAMPSDDNSRLVDREIMEASQDGSIFAFVVAPTTVFGNTECIIPRRSHQIFDLVRCAVAERYMLFPGDGRNTGNGIHLHDLLDLIVSLLQLARFPAASLPEHTQFFFASGSAFSWSQVAQTIAKVLHRRGRINSEGVYECSPNLHPELRRFRNNYAVESLRAQSLGWSPSQGLSFESHLESEIHPDSVYGFYVWPVVGRVERSVPTSAREQPRHSLRYLA